ncbi:hypothetical protein [Heyndrickxia ginsengihumi]|uniref:hypothetical protein n=1 Tax=Heyndrickxia ginsengihumi TaxID=363870 RepID=UPI0004725CBE|nr:hypothetical protein [Heyndrickxia ginsengihumi]
MVKTKRFMDYWKDDKYFGIDKQINKFLEENNITREKLIDIKLSCTGYANNYNSDRERDNALLIYEE